MYSSTTMTMAESEPKKSAHRPNGTVVGCQRRFPK